MLKRIALSVFLFASACHGKGGDTTPLRAIARDIAKCATDVLTSNGIGTSPSEPAKDPE